MGARAFDAPARRTHRVTVSETGLHAEHSWGKELGHRVLMLLVGGLAAGFFLVPWIVLPDHLLSIGLLFAAVGLPLGALVLWSVFLVPPKPFDLTVADGWLEVRQAPGRIAGTYPAEQVQAICRTRKHGTTYLGLFIDGVGPVGILRSQKPAPIDEAQAALVSALAASPEAPGGGWPVWQVAPDLGGRQDLPVGPGGTPAGWPEHPVVGVSSDGSRVEVTLPPPSHARRVLAYSLGLAPLLAGIVALVAVALLSPPGSWNPWAVLADPDALVLAIVGTWIVASLPASRKLTARVHDLVGKGPYVIRVDQEQLAVLGVGREVIDQVPVDDVEGFEVGRLGLSVVHGDQLLRLPVYSLKTSTDRAWVAQGLAYAIDRWGGRRLPRVALAVGDRRPRGDRPAGRLTTDAGRPGQPRPGPPGP